MGSRTISEILGRIFNSDSFIHPAKCPSSAFSGLNAGECHANLRDVLHCTPQRLSLKKHLRDILPGDPEVLSFVDWESCVSADEIIFVYTSL
jgi:hypothetical protein